MSAVGNFARMEHMLRGNAKAQRLMARSSWLLKIREGIEDFLKFGRCSQGVINVNANVDSRSWGRERRGATN